MSWKNAKPVIAVNPVYGNIAKTFSKYSINKTYFIVKQSVENKSHFVWHAAQRSITLCVTGVGECLSCHLFPYETGVEYHAQNREIKRCTSHYILDREIHRAVLTDIQDILRLVQQDKEAFYETVMSKISATESKNAAAMQREAKDLETRIQTLERKYDMMYEDRLNGIITDTKFREMAAKCEEEQRAAEARLQELRQSIEAIGSHEDAVHDFIEAAEQYTTVTELDRELLHTLVDSIIIGDRVRTAEGIQQTITVNYKFMGRTAAKDAA